MESVNKRIRISKGQSKYGCFTCRARRIKCDEQKPSCAKCQKAMLECEGYPPGVSTDRESSSRTNLGEEQESSASDHISRSSSLSRTMTQVVSMASTQESLIQSGLDLLLRSYCDEHTIGQAALRFFIDQNKPSSPAVRAACAALGAAHELQQNIRQPASHTKLVFETNYGQAITLVKSGIEGIRYDSIAIAVACIVLSAVEIVRRRKQNAYMHVRGAYQALKSNGPKGVAATVIDTVNQHDSSLTVFRETAQNSNIDLLTLLRIYDLQMLAFAKSAQPAAIDPIPLQALQITKAEIASANSVDKQAVELLHASVTHLNTTAHTIISGGGIEKIMDDYSQYVTLLLGWVSLFTDRLATETSRKHKQHLLILRNLCMSLAIEMQALIADNETAWDSHAQWFQDIITSGEHILEYHREWTKQETGLPKDGFALQLGMLQPVYLAALKYREHKWRRRAIDCLQKMNREGPWIGQMMAAIAQRIMDLEESFVQSSRVSTSLVSKAPQASNPPQLAHSLSEEVSEQARISFHCLTEENRSTDDDPWPSTDAGRVAIRTFKRKQPVNMLDVFVLTAAHFGSPQIVTSHLKHHKLDMDNWLENLEEIGFGPNAISTEV